MADAGRRLAGALLTAALLAGCSFTPRYAPPAPPPVAAFKESGPFTLALPADTLPPGAWWRVYDDPVLNDLEQRVASANPTLQGALAAYDQAQAFIGEARAGLGVQASAGGAASYNRQSDNRPLRGRDQPNEYAANTVSGSVGYELDVWGRVRSLVASASDLAQASSDDVAGVKLALQTQLAQTYFRLREQDAEIVLLRNTVAAYGRADRLVETRHAGGIASGLEVSRARAQLASARAQVNDAGAQRALYEHAIASLVGQPASTFSVALDARTDPVVTAPTGVPSTLLQRRPDVAAAERRIAAANEQIGAAKAAFYPAITLSASGGFQNTGGPDFFSPGNTLWSFGPSGLLTLLDGGRRHAVEAAAYAARGVAAADYRARVLSAFQDVEDQLATLNHLGAAAVDQTEAVKAAARTEDLATIRYQQGATNYLDVVIAQTAALQARQAALNLRSRQLQGSVALIRAIGGGWTQPTVT